MLDPNYIYFFPEEDFDISEAIENLSNEKKDNLVNCLKNILAAFAEKIFKDKMNATFVSTKSLKEYFIYEVVESIKKKFNDDIDVARHSKLAVGKKIFYNIEILQGIFDKKFPTPFDQKILKKLGEVKHFALDLGLDIESTKKEQQLVFTISEEDEKRDIFCTTIPENNLI